MGAVRTITKSQVDVLLEFASKDDKRAVLHQNVFLGEDDERKPVFVATDGRRIIVMETPTVEADEYPKTQFQMEDTGAVAILPGSFLQKAVANLPGKTSLNMLKFAPIVVGEKISKESTSEARKIASPLNNTCSETLVQDTSFDGLFPRHQAVMPDFVNDRRKYPIMFTLDAKLLLGTAKALARHVKDNGRNYVQIYIPAKAGDPIVFDVSSSSSCLGAKVAFMPMRAAGEYSDIPQLHKEVAYLASLLIKGEMSPDDKRAVAMIAIGQNVEVPEGFAPPAPEDVDEVTDEPQGQQELI